MLKDTAMKIKNVISPGRIKYNVNELTLHHRLAASPGIVACAEEIAAKFALEGIESGTWEYPTSNEVVKGGFGFDNSWDCREGWCEVIGEGGRRIADWYAERLSVMASSAPCDHRETPIELIPIDKGLEEEAYEGIDFTGKAIFLKGEGGTYFNIGPCLKWAQKRGAVGVVSGVVSQLDDVRGVYNQYDTIAWFTVGRHIKNFFGFGITPREADKLYRRYQREGKLFIRCYIDCVDTAATMKNAWGIIRGTEKPEEEIVMTGHICHPRPSANDNMSGTTAVMEALRALHQMIKDGQLPAPRRSIRAMLLPEMLGSAAALEDWKEHGKFMGGINLDMVGARQGDGVGPIGVYDVHPSVPSFIGSVQGIALDAAKSDTPDFVKMGDDINMYNWHETMYSSGSDQDVWTDALFGMPMTSMTQWPDKFYHSSSDEAHVIDPQLCARSSSIAASTAYILACLTPDDLPEIMTRSYEIMTREMKLLARRCPADKLGKAAKVYAGFFTACNNDFLRFFSGEELERVRPMVEAQNRNIKAFVEMMASTAAGKPICLDDYTCDGTGLEGLDFVPVKTCIGRVYDVTLRRKEDGQPISDEYNKKYGSALSGYTRQAIQCFCDGTRTAAEIIDISCAIGNSWDYEAAKAYLQLLIDMKWVEVK